MTVKQLSIAPFAGSNTGWGGTLPLTHEYPDEIVLDLTNLRFVVPTFLLRLRTFIDWHRARDRQVTIVCPKSADVNRYLARMHVHDGLPAGTFKGLKSVSEHDRSDVLIPLTQLHDLPQVDRFVEDLSPVVDAHVADVGPVAQPFLLAVSELTQNAVEHGRSESGCYVAAQRYPSQHSLALCIADLGPGIPEHLRREYPDIANDALAILRATQEGVSGTGESDRGYGLSQVMEEVLAASTVTWANFVIRSGYGQYSAHLVNDDLLEVTTEEPYKRGSWVSFEFAVPA